MVQVLYIKHVSFCAYSNGKQKSMQVIRFVHPVFFHIDMEKYNLQNKAVIHNFHQIMEATQPLPL